MKRTRRCAPIKSELVVVGVDVAKEKHVAVALAGSGESSKALRFEVSQAGFRKLLAWSQERVKRWKAEGFVVAMEPTGHYGATLVSWLKGQGVVVYSVAASHTSRAKTLYDGTTRKTDPKDALVVASLCRQGLCRPYRVLEGAYAELRVLSQQRRQLVKRRSQVVNRLHRHVDVVFPELRKLFPKIERRTSLWVLETMPTPAEVLSWSTEDLAAALYEASRWQLGRKRAERMLEAARSSVGLTLGVESHRLVIRQLLAELRHVLAQLREVEKAMEACLARVPYAALLLTIPQMGVVTTATLLGEFGDLRDYKVAKQLIAMAGLDLVERSSGQRQGHHHISRRGRAYARQMLYLAALRVGWGFMAEPRRRQVEDRNKPPTKAAVANMARLLRVMHAIARTGKPFDPSRFAPKELPMAA